MASEQLRSAVILSREITLPVELADIWMLLSLVKRSDEFSNRILIMRPTQPLKDGAEAIVDGRVLDECSAPVEQHCIEGAVGTSSCLAHVQG